LARASKDIQEKMKRVDLHWKSLKSADKKIKVIHGYEIDSQNEM